MPVTDEQLIRKIILDEIENQRYLREGLGRFEVELYVMQANANNVFNRPVGSSVPVLGRLIVLFKKAVRRCVAWYNNPFAQQQSAYNEAAAECAASLGRQVEQLQKQNAELLQRLQRLEAKTGKGDASCE